MLLIDRYLLRQLLGPTVLATAALAAVALLSQSLSALDLIVGQRQSALVFAKVTLAAELCLVRCLPGLIDETWAKTGSGGFLSRYNALLSAAKII